MFPWQQRMLSCFHLVLLDIKGKVFEQLRCYGLYCYYYCYKSTQMYNNPIPKAILTVALGM